MNRKESRRGNAALRQRGRWLLLPVLLLMGWNAQAQCTGQPNSQGHTDCVMHNVILPQQQQQREAAERYYQQRPPAENDQWRAEVAERTRHGWGALAASPGLTHIGMASDLTSRGKAEKQALADCKKQGGIDCALLGTVNNICLALARNPDGVFAVAHDAGDSVAAEQAIKQCNDKSPDKVCRLHSAMVCPGQARSNRDPKVSPEDYARALEARLDKRTLWGAVAGDGRKLYFVANAVSAEAAGKSALADCGGAGCKVLATSERENQCLAAAWVPGASSSPIVAEDGFSVDVRLDALRQCVSAYGQSCAVSPSICSDRQLVATAGDGSVRKVQTMHDGIRAEDTRESLAPWVGKSTFDFQRLWNMHDRWDDGGDLLAKQRTLFYDYTIQAGRGRPARNCVVAWNEVNEQLASYTLKGDGCRFLFK